MLPGTYNFIGDAIEVIRSEAWTREILQQLKIAVDEALRAESTPEQFVSAHPEAARVVEVVVAQQGRTGRKWLSALGAIIVGVATVGASVHDFTTSSLSEEDAARIAVQVVREMSTAPPRRRSPRAGPKRPRRAPKTHGKTKRRRPRH